MKKRILFMLCVLVVTFSLTACDEEKPHRDTETETASSEDSGSEDITVSENAPEENNLMFYESATSVVKVPTEEYDALPQGLFFAGIMENETEWTTWSKGKGIKVSYNTKMWDTNLLLVFYYKGTKNATFDIEKINKLSYDGEEILVTDSVMQGMEFELLETPGKYDVVYQLLWIKRSELAEKTKLKYALNHLYMIDEDDTYRIYLSQTGSYIHVDHSEDGGDTWINEGYGMNQLFGTGMGEVMASFVDDKTAYILYTSDAAAGRMHKTLYYIGDADRYIKEVTGDVGIVDNYPVGMDFYNKDIGYIITNYHNSKNYIYRTEDGGQTWQVINIPEIEAEYLYMEGHEIECLSEKEARLVVQIVNSQRKYRKEFYTYDGGQTWRSEALGYGPGLDGEND